MSSERIYLPNTPQNFYALAWAERLKFVQSLVACGETDVSRIIRILERHERKFQLKIEHASYTYSEPQDGPEKIDVFTGHAEWVPVDHGSDAELLPTGVPAVTENSFLGKKLTLPAYTDLSVIVANWIVDLIDEDCSSVVELGCGYGRNLFNIHYLGGPLGIPYYGTEYTETGRALASFLASLECAIDLRVDHFDHTSVDLRFIEESDHLFAFTCHSIEQVAEIPDSYFEDLAKSAKKLTCIHFEPFGFQISANNPYSVRQKDFFIKRGWNTNFFDVLKTAANTGTINLTHVYKDIIPNEEISPTSVAIWRNF